MRRLFAAVASIAAGDPPVRYHRDPSTGDFFPEESTFAERVPQAGSSLYLVAPPPLLMKIIRITGLEDMLPVHRGDRAGHVQVA